MALKAQAVLFRAAHHSGPVEVELVRRNVPLVKFGGLKFLDAAHVRCARSAPVRGKSARPGRRLSGAASASGRRPGHCSARARCSSAGRRCARDAAQFYAACVRCRGLAVVRAASSASFAKEGPDGQRNLTSYAAGTNRISSACMTMPLLATEAYRSADRYRGSSQKYVAVIPPASTGPGRRSRVPSRLGPLHHYTTQSRDPA
jgi:hypothetical protein